MEYFYREALRLQESAGQAAGAELESAFRYPGPKPQNRENGIIMLADTVESASRALKDPTPSSLRKLVKDLLTKRLLDGQFEDSGLTLTELAPWGVIGAVTPSTNPAATIINNGLSMIASGNAVVFGAHPLAKNVTNRTIHLMNAASAEVGGPETLLTAVAEPSIEAAQANAA